MGVARRGIGCGTIAICHGHVSCILWLRCCSVVEIVIFYVFPFTGPSLPVYVPYVP